METESDAKNGKWRGRKLAQAPGERRFVTADRSGKQNNNRGADFQSRLVECRLQSSRRTWRSAAAAMRWYRTVMLMTYRRRGVHARQGQADGWQRRQEHQQQDQHRNFS